MFENDLELLKRLVYIIIEYKNTNNKLTSIKKLSKKFNFKLNKRTSLFFGERLKVLYIK